MVEEKKEWGFFPEHHSNIIASYIKLGITSESLLQLCDVYIFFYSFKY